MKHFVFALAAASAASSIQSQSWRFTKRNFSLCEGVGIHDSYAVDVRAEIEAASGGRWIRSLSVGIQSAAKPDGGGATLRIRKGEEAISVTQLVSPWFPTIGAPNGGLFAYLPKDPAEPASSRRWHHMQAVWVPDGAKVEVTTAPIADECALGAGSFALDM